MRRNRITSRAGRWIFAGAAAFFLMQSVRTGEFSPANEVFASGGTQQESAVSDESGQPDKAGQPDETEQSDELEQEDFTGLLDEEQKALLDELLKKLEDGELSTREQIDEAIGQAQEELGVTLTREQEEQLAKLVLRANELGLDREDILNGAQALYEKYGSQIMESANDAIRDNIVEPAKEAVVTETKKTLRDYFHDMGETVKKFVKNLIG